METKFIGLEGFNEIESLPTKKRKDVYKRQEHCNDMWQTDFKGEFLTADNRYCYPLTILDDSSRSVSYTHLDVYKRQNMSSILLEVLRKS